MKTKSLFTALIFIVTGLPVPATAAGIGRIAGENGNGPAASQLPLIKVFKTPNQVGRILRERGWRDLRWIDRWLPGYVLEGCRGRDRYRIRTNRNAVIKRKQRIGSCDDIVHDGGRPAVRTGLRPADLRPLLRERGFRSIEITDRFLPGYGVTACRGGERFALRLNRFGDIRRRTRVGSCDVARAEGIVRASGLRPLLRARGYYNIEILDGQLPRYVTRACKNNGRFRIVLNRFGGITRTERVGRCGQVRQTRGKSLPQIRDILRSRRYYDIQFTDRELPGYGARACRNIRRFTLRLNRFGEIKKRKAIGWCKPGSVIQIFKAPPRRITRSELESTRRLRADDCQDYLESLLESDTILFDVGSAEIGRESFPLLRRLARTINRCPDAHVEIAGHTDSDGSRADNQDLSERRAESVRRFLIDRGVRRRQLSAIGYGEDRPIARNDTRAQKARNRRIEFVVDWDEE